MSHVTHQLPNSCMSKQYINYETNARKSISKLIEIIAELHCHQNARSPH